MPDGQSGIEIWGGTATDVDNFRRAMDGLREAADVMEMRVEERTAELLKANRELARRVEERSTVEPALLDSQALFQNAFEHAGVGIALVGLDGLPDRANAALAQMLGYEEGQLEGLSIDALIHPDDRADLEEHAAALLRGDRESLRSDTRSVTRAGDEFAVFLPDTVEDGAVAIAEKILQAVGAPYSVDEYTLEVSTGVGVALFPVHADSYELLMQRADMAMYVARRSGRGVAIHDAQLHARE